MIYVTLGTMFLGFPRLVEAMDGIAETTGERVIVQYGLSAAPRVCEGFEFKPRAEVLSIQAEARVIVAHAGIGSVLDALEARRPLIVAPRLRRFHEHMNDHQIDLAGAVERRRWGRMVFDMSELADACAHPPAAPERYRPARGPLVESIRSFLDGVARVKGLGS